MVKKLIISLMLLALTAIALFYAAGLLTSEETKIRERFSRTASVIHRDEEEKPIANMVIARSLQTLFADPCTVNAPSRSISQDYTPRELASLIIRARQPFKDLSLSFHDLKITIRDETTADAVFTALLRGTREGRSFREAREMKAKLKKHDRRWLFTRIKVVQVLRK